MIRIIIETQDFKNSKMAKKLKTAIFGQKCGVSKSYGSKMTGESSTCTLNDDCTVDMYF